MQKHARTPTTFHGSPCSPASSARRIGSSPAAPSFSSALKGLTPWSAATRMNRPSGGRTDRSCEQTVASSRELADVDLSSDSFKLRMATWSLESSLLASPVGSATCTNRLCGHSNKPSVKAEVSRRELKDVDFSADSFNLRMAAWSLESSLLASPASPYVSARSPGRMSTSPLAATWGRGNTSPRSRAPDLPYTPEHDVFRIVPAPIPWSMRLERPK